MSLYAKDDRAPLGGWVAGWVGGWVYRYFFVRCVRGLELEMLNPKPPKPPTLHPPLQRRTLHSTQTLHPKP